MTVTPLVKDVTMEANTTTKILAVAARSNGIVTRAVLLDAGIASSTISRRLADGTLLRVCDGVYEAPLLTDELTPLVRALTAVPGSVLSRRTASSTYGYPLPHALGVHVTAPKGVGWTLPGTFVHESRSLCPVDIVTSPDGLPVTSPARTIVDLAAELSPQQLRHVVTTQVAKGAPTIEELVECFGRLARRGRTGVGLLRPILDDLVADAPPVPQSELENRVWAGLRRRGLHGFSPQFKPAWFDGRRGVVDFAHRRARVIIEADGRRWHARHQAMVDDRQRDRTAAANGWVVIRVMWEDIAAEAGSVFDEIAAVVEARLADPAA